MTGTPPTPHAAQGPRLTRSLRMDAATVQRLLDELDAREAMAGEARNRRCAERYGYRVNECIVYLQQPGDPRPAAYLAPTRNLSAGGIAFLHGGFVHNGSRCVVRLATRQKVWSSLAGTVVTCRLIQGHVHEVSVRFDQVVDPSIYCQDAVKLRVLLAEDDTSLVRLADVYLQRLNAIVDHASDGREAVEKACRDPYDVILMDMEMPVMDGFEATRELRNRGYAGTIVAATGLTEDSDRKKCIEAGCDTHIAKPYRSEDLARLFEAVHEEPLVSSLAQDEGMVTLIDDFVKELPDKLRSVEEAIAAADLNQLAVAARMLKSDAGGYGFDPISDAAASVEKAARAESAIEQIKPIVRELTKWCMLARSPLAAAPGPAAGKPDTGRTPDEQTPDAEANGGAAGEAREDAAGDPPPAEAGADGTPND